VADNATAGFAPTDKAIQHSKRLMTIAILLIVFSFVLPDVCGNYVVRNAEVKSFLPSRFYTHPLVLDTLHRSVLTGDKKTAADAPAAAQYHHSALVCRSSKNVTSVKPSFWFR
jgi:hypothetical protein